MPMKKSSAPVFALAFALILSGVALANPGSSANQTVSFEVAPIAVLAFSGNPEPLVIDSATAGLEPADAVDTSTSWAFTTNHPSSRISATLDLEMPMGTSLSVLLQAPESAFGEGYVGLNEFPHTLIYGIEAGALSGLQVGYRLHAPVESGFIGSSSRTVTFTLSDDEI